MKEQCAPAPTRFDAVVFDFDYTLADSSRGAAECIRFALSELGLPQITYEEACRTIGHSLPETFRVLTGRTDGADAFARLFVERAEAVMADGTVLLEHTRPTIEQLAAAGVALGIVSNKFRRRVEEVLAREQLRQAFDAIVGEEDVAAPKPDPEGLHRAVSSLRAARAVYVGDSVVDARTAARAGVPFVAVCTGTTPPAAFDQYAPCAVLDDLTELYAIVIDGSRWRRKP